MKTLVIAEKPSVAADIVRALTPQVGKFEKFDDHFENDSYVVTSAVGHLLEIQVPEEFDVKRGKWSFAHLPVIPPHFDLKPVDKTKSRLNAVLKQAKRKDVTQLINACDAGREGELIFRLIEQYAGGAKPLGKPVQRLWLQSMTPAAIREGFEKLRSNEDMRGLADAARSRSEADWLVGINGTRAMTAFNSRDGGFFLTTVGRVQTPTLAIVVEREEQIRKHIARDYWEITAEFAAQAGSYSGKWLDLAWKKPVGDLADSDAKADRLWNKEQALAIAAACQGKPAVVKEETKPTTQAAPMLFDLTSLQREANGKFGYSAKTTLQIAQSLYERHKALTYPRTDSRALPEDYIDTVKASMEMLAASHLKHLAPHAKTALQKAYVKPNKRIFNNAKVSDHFAIVPTNQEPVGLSEAEQKIYDLVTRRFLSVFFPSAQYAVTTRISTVEQHAFKTEGKVLIEAGWLAIYGKEAANELDDKEKDDGAKSQTLVAVAAGERPVAAPVETKGLRTRPPARYSEATLLGAMEGAGKWIEDDELREAMQEKGLGTPATRAAIIEGLLQEKYMLREGREMIPTAKAFQLMTLLRGLEVVELSKPALTGEWEFKLAQIEQGKLSRASFMQEIAAMTERMVKKAKEYDRDTIPGDYATLTTPCPNCAGVVKENYRRYVCVGAAGATENKVEGCGFSIPKTPGGRTFNVEEVEQLLREQRIGPLEGFRSKAGWPFVAEIQLVRDEEIKNFKLEFDFGSKDEDSGEIMDFSNSANLGKCPICASAVYESERNYVCEKAVPTAAQPTPSCTFKSGKIILQQPIEPEQMRLLLETGKTELLDKFVSTRTRRPFKAMLAWSAEEGKVIFEFAPRADGKVFARKAPAKKMTKAAAAKAAKVAKTAATKEAKAAPAKKVAAKKVVAPKAPRAGNLSPSPALAAVIGEGKYGRGEVTKKLWDYIKENKLQSEQDRRVINADDKLKAVFGGESAVNMMKLAGFISKHLQ